MEKSRASIIWAYCHRIKMQVELLEASALEASAHMSLDRIIMMMMMMMLKTTEPNAPNRLG